MSKTMNIIGKFSKNKNYTIVSVENKLYALLNLKDDGSYDKKFECEQFGSNLYGIGKEIK